MDYPAVQSAIGSLKLAYDITKSLVNLNSISEMKTKTIELQNAVLAAQNFASEANAHQASMIEDIANLKQEIVRLKDWETKKQRYQLTTLWDGGTVAYGVKESMCNGDPPHWICTNCYEDGRKSILIAQKTGRLAVYVCPMCHFQMSIPGDVIPRYVKQNS